MFPHRLKQFRESLNLTQEELAKKLNLTQSTIAYYESGKKMPTLENAKIIAELFNTSLDYLLGLSDNNNKLIKESNEIKLSPESQEDLEAYIKLLKIRDMQKRNTEFSDELTTLD